MQSTAIRILNDVVPRKIGPDNLQRMQHLIPGLSGYSRNASSRFFSPFPRKNCHFHKF